MSRLTTSIFALTACLLPVTAFSANCPEGFPAQPINFTVGYGAGGGTDTTARKVAEMLERNNGWTVVVENKPGANGGVMAIGLMKSDPDGYNLGVTATSTLSVNPHRDDSIPYTYEDFRYIGSGMLLNFGLVALEDRPYDTMEEFIEYARENGRATVSAAAFASELMVQELADHYDVTLIAVPAKGSAAALKDTLGGHVDATIQATLHVDQLRAGNMVQLATLTNERAAYAPDAKTVEELGLPAGLEGHIVFMLPKETPDDVFSCLSGALEEVTSSEDYTAFMKGRATVPANLGPVGAEAHLAERSDYYKKALENIGN